jgi:hypothetical protein
LALTKKRRCVERVPGTCYNFSFPTASCCCYYVSFSLCSCVYFVQLPYGVGHVPLPSHSQNACVRRKGPWSRRDTPAGGTCPLKDTDETQVSSCQKNNLRRGKLYPDPIIRWFKGGVRRTPLDRRMAVRLPVRVRTSEEFLA